MHIRANEIKNSFLHIHAIIQTPGQWTFVNVMAPENGQVICNKRHGKQKYTPIYMERDRGEKLERHSFTVRQRIISIRT